MPKNEQPSATSSPDSEATPSDISLVKAPPQQGFDLYSFRESEEGKAVVSWAMEQFSKCRSQKTTKHQTWVDNIAFVLGHQWIQRAVGTASSDFLKKLKPTATPRYMNRRTVNRIRSFVRTEQSKFLSTMPNINVVPSTAEEEDVRSAYAGEQVIESYQSKRKLRREYSKAVWWMITTGNGLLKQWWDPTTEDPTSKEMGDIVYRSVSPFNFFVPDMREQEIDDQPYVIQAQVKTLTWVQQFYGEELKGKKLEPDQISTNGLLDDAYFNLANTPKSDLDSVIVMEMWIKPGTHDKMPNGGLLVFAGEVLVGAFTDGLPYEHGQYPYTKIEHMANGTFWADSPIVDLKELQREFNDVRTQVGVAAKRMGNPQLLAQQGSIVPGRMSNEPGMIIEYRPGTPPPNPIPLQPLPEYVINQLQQILTDFEDLSGQHQITKAQAPTGVTAGTALSFLREIDDNYLTPQYQSVEDGFERLASQTLDLFKQFVDQPRKIKVIGLDGAFDSALLSGADVTGGSDVRVEPGSSIGESQAAKRAAVMDMFSVGIITDPNQALRLLEVGGAQKILDTVAVAEKKAQRENMKLKAFGTPEGQQQIELYTQQHAQQMVEQMASDPDLVGQAVDPSMITPDALAQNPEVMQFIMAQIPPIVPADDFDMHAIHIDVHNRYRMGQEYETLPDPVKEQFDKHVQMHQQLMQQQMYEQMMTQQMAGNDMDQPVGDPGAAPAAGSGAPMPDSMSAGPEQPGLPQQQ